MIRVLIACVTAIIVALNCSAQIPLNEQPYPDSLQSILKQRTSDSVKARVNYLLSEYWVTKDTAKARTFLEQGKQLSSQYPFNQVLYYYYAAYLYSRSNTVLSEATFLKTDSLLIPYTQKEALLFRAKSWHRYGVLQQMKDDHKAFADIILNKVIPLAQQAGDSVYIGKNYMDLGIVFKNTGKYDKAETYCLKAIEVLKKAHAPADQLVVAYHTIAENYTLSGKNPAARAVLDSAWALLAPYPESEHLLDYYAAEGMYFTVQGQFDKALASLDKGIALAKKRGLRYEEQRLQMQQFYALYNSNNFAKARDVVLHLMKQPEMMSQLSNRLQLYFGLAETYAGLHDMIPAYQWLKRYSQLSDSVYESRLKNDINALEIKYRNAENQKRIAALEAEKQQASLTAKNVRLTIWLLAVGSLAGLITTALFVFYYRNSKKLAEQKEINYRQQLRELEQQQELATSHAMLEGEERERSRVARDLHDGLGGMLAGIKIKLSDLATRERNPLQHNNLHGIVTQLDNSVSELRHIAHNMMPENLLKFGLETAMKDLSESLNSSHTHIDFQAYGIEKTIAIPVQVTIYRIVQEALANAIRHAEATEILLQCSQNGHTFFITVEDNGKGFSQEAIDGKTGIGMSNIRNRVKYLKGKLDISSAINEGTTINIELNVAD